MYGNVMKVYLKHKLAILLIRVGFAMLEPGVREEAIRLMRIGFRKGIL